jgi:hypothetical protein
MRKLYVFAALLVSFSFSTHAKDISESEALQIGIEAYIYFYPLVTMDVTRRQATNSDMGVSPFRGPMNSFVNIRQFPSAEFRDVVRPNFDTLYSSAWLDLTKGPLIVTTPDTDDRYYLLPMLDMWSDVFAAPGKRTTGTSAQNFAVIPPRWNGDLPKDVIKLEAPTPYIWIIGRTQTNGPADYAAVNKIQDGFTIHTLEQWKAGVKPEPAKVAVDKSIDMKTPPLEQVNKMNAEKYFTYAAELMKLHPPHITDQAQIARFKRIGIEPGKSFAYTKASATVKSGLRKATGDALKQLVEKVPTLAQVFNGWQMNTSTMGVYGNYYIKRAIVAMVGLGANQPEDAIYPMSISDAKGNKLDGKNSYVLKFKKADLPPADAFWSITLYDQAGFQVANAIKRFAIGDRDSLKYNSDGSLDIYVQSATPGNAREANWLPSPATGEFNLTMRLYAPRLAALTGSWIPPGIMRVEERVNH